MRNESQEVLESSRPNMCADESIDFVLERLYKDKEHNIEDEIVNKLTFEELIGTLLLAKDLIQEETAWRHAQT